jgi:hypothetical protein
VPLHYLVRRSWTEQSGMFVVILDIEAFVRDFGMVPTFLYALIILTVLAFLGQRKRDKADVQPNATP